MKRRPGRAAAWLAVAACAALAFGCTSVKYIGVNERIHHDDFEYRVAGFTVADSIGSGEARKQAAGRFYVVEFVVENRARRVSHAWNDSIAYLTDDQGRTHENLPAMQTLLNSVEPFRYSARHLTPAGETESTKLVFDLPNTSTRPCLMVRGELLMGDVCDAKAFTRTKVRLF